jgi:quercetin dioxygenase-like cupin family protein
MAELIVRRKFASPVDRSTVAGDWGERGFSCELFVDPPGREWNGFAHRADELVTVVEGRLELEIGGERFVAEPGDELFIPRGVTHSVRNRSTGTTRWLYGYG